MEASLSIMPSSATLHTNNLRTLGHDIILLVSTQFHAETPSFFLVINITYEIIKATLKRRKEK
jgi:hypothetical protein